MIGKIFGKNSGSFKNRIRYIFGCTKHDHEISRIQTIDSNCFTSDPLPDLLNGDDGKVMAMVQEFDQVEKLRKLSIDSEKTIKPVFHAILSLRPGESLTPAQWQTAVRKYLKDLGFRETHKYVAVLHEDTDHEHVHIVANRIELNEGFRVLSDSNERSKNIDSVSEIEDMYGLEKAPKPTETWGVNISRAELEASVKDNEIPFKHIMIAKIAASIEKTVEKDGDMIDFVRLLRKQKVYIHLTLNEEGQPKGIAYEYNDKVISGRQLKRARLTFQKLTNQEGIKYDPQTISELQREIAIRDEEDQTRIRISARRRRYYYYMFNSPKRKVGIKFKADPEALLKILKLVALLLLLLFGVKFTYKPAQRNDDFYEYEPNKPFEPHLHNRGLEL